AHLPPYPTPLSLHSALPISARLGHQADDLAVVDVEQAVDHQQPVHRRVEPRIIDHIVDVAVDVVVHPARGDGLEAAVVAAFGPLDRSGHGVSPWALTLATRSLAA